GLAGGVHGDGRPVLADRAGRSARALVDGEGRAVIEVNPQNSQLSKASGILAVETPDGHQQWALVADAEIRYDNDVTVSYGESPQFTVIATLPPGESLRTAGTIEAGEEN